MNHDMHMTNIILKKKNTIFSAKHKNPNCKLLTNEKNQEQFQIK